MKNFIRRRPGPFSIYIRFALLIAARFTLLGDGLDKLGKSKREKINKSKVKACCRALEELQRMSKVAIGHLGVSRGVARGGGG